MNDQNNIYCFFDRGFLQPQGIDNASIHINKATRDNENNPLFTEGWKENPVLPWEVRYDNAYPNVIYDEEYDIFRCYYTLITKDVSSEGVSREQRSKTQYIPKVGREVSLAYAESKDGVNWYKPKLNFVEYKGSKENNLMFKFAHGTGVFLDKEEKDSSKRYKLVTKVEYPYGFSFMAVNFSQDGIHWGDMIPWKHYNPAADSHNFPFRDKKDNKFKIITRTWSSGVRLSAICESDDFINWSAPKEILRGSGFESQVYSMPVFQHNGYYIGLASMFHEGNRIKENFDTVDLELCYANNDDYFNFVKPNEYILDRANLDYLNGEFDCGCIYAAAPISYKGKTYMYYMGGNGRHTGYRETSFARAEINLDKLAYYAQDDENIEGFLPSTSAYIYGNNLDLLADIENEGYIKVAIKPRWNQNSFEGYDFDDSHLEKQSDGKYRICFSKKLSELDVASCNICFKFKKAKIYSISGAIANLSSRVKVWLGE